MGPSAGAKDCSVAGMMKMEGDFHSYAVRMDDLSKLMQILTKSCLA